MGYTVDYAKGVLFSVGGESDKSDIGIYSNLFIGYGIGKNWDIGLSFPYIFNQTFDEGQGLAAFETTGLLESRISTKFNFYRFSAGGGLAVLGHVGINRTKNLPFFGDKSGLSYTLEIALDKKWGSWLLGANLGYRLFDSGNPLMGFSAFEPYTNTILASVALKYILTTNWSMVGEIWLSRPDIDFVGVDRKPESLEALWGGIYNKKNIFRHDSDLNITLGLTKGLGSGVSTPDLRFFAGVSYALSPYSKKAKVTDLPQKTFADSVFESGPEQASNQESEDEIKKESFYNPGYRQGYLAGFRKDEHADGNTDLNLGYESDVGFADGYQDSAHEVFPAKYARTTFAQAYHEGFNARQKKGPYANFAGDKDHGSKVSNDPEYIEGYELGWLDAPEYQEISDEINLLTVNDSNTEEFQELEPKKSEIISFENINFYFNSALINKRSYKILEKLADHLRKADYKFLQIYGHTDNVGDDLYNEKLSLERARSVYRYLKSQGFSEKKMDFDGWGKRKPVAPNDTPQNRYKNRRVEFLITR